MNIRTLLSLVVITVSLGTLGPVVAADMEALPEAQTQNGITYLSGGIGLDESEAMKAAAKDYTLMITCSVQPTGKYLADVKVNITDKSGSPMLETVIDGPMLLVQLAPGQYRISAENDGVTMNRTVDIGSEHPTRVNLSWPAGADQ
jgi:hypothetical protein